jgi:hypothetical protein
MAKLALDLKSILASDVSFFLKREKEKTLMFLKYLLWGKHFAI